MKKYRNYINEDSDNSDKYKDFLLNFSYIGEYSVPNKNGLYIVNPYNINSFDKKKYHNLRNYDLTYSSLFRYYLFAWLFKYERTGTNKTILNIIKLYNDDDYLVYRTINQMPYNNIIFSKVQTIVKFNKISDFSFKLLTEFINKKDNIFNENNIIKWFNIVYKNTINANKSEYHVQLSINNNKILNIKDARTVPSFMDKKGIDILAKDENNNKKKIQVKRISPISDLKVTQKNSYTIAIYNSQLDLRDYEINKNKIIYDYLYLYLDYEKKRLIVIDTKKIFSIKVFDPTDTKNNIRIIYINIDSSVTSSNVTDYLKSYYI